MFRSVSPGKKNPAAKAFFSLFCSLFLALLLFPVLGCQTESDDDDGIGFNPGLLGTWVGYFADPNPSDPNDRESTDVYFISPAKLSHHSYSAYPDPNLSGTIVFVSAFDASSGCLIIKRETDNKYTAVYYKDLAENTVKLGDASDPDATDYDPAVDTLEGAVARFTGEDKDYYGAGLIYAGTLTKI
jgi:hypothetical protein